MSLLSTLPTYEANSFARWVAEATEKYFEDPEVRKRFEEWKKERESNGGKKVRECGPKNMQTE